MYSAIQGKLDITGATPRCADYDVPAGTTRSENGFDPLAIVL
jgi:hypothetical protein